MAAAILRRPRWGVLGGLLLLGCSGTAEQSPARVPGGPDEPARIVLDPTAPRGVAQLLWLDGRPVVREGGHQWVTDGAGGWMALDGALAPLPTHLPSTRPYASLAITVDGRYWGTDGFGVLHSLSDSASLRPQILLGDVVADPRTSALWIVRSPTRFTFRMPGEVIPLLERWNPGAPEAESIGAPWMPDDLLMQDVANSGHLVVQGDTVYFAPLTRDEVVAFTRTGDTLWRFTHDSARRTPAPRFAMESGRPTPMIPRVNHGFALGPQGTLFLLAAADSAGMHGRLDEIDRRTGALLATVTLPTLTPTVAVANDGRVHLLSGVALLAGVAPSRMVIPELSLPLLGDSTPRPLSAYRGRPLILNFWASWCAPCRRELPLLDSLRRVLAPEGITVLGMNDDQYPRVAARFVAELAPEFPSLTGGGMLATRLGLIGLPVTLLLDAEGAVVGQWTGELTADTMRRLAAAARSLAGAGGQRPAATRRPAAP